jgi:hypothetical protein
MCRRRQHATSAPLEAMAEIDEPGAAARLRRSELGEIVRAMLAQVSPMSREVLALRYLAGYSEAELAAAYGGASAQNFSVSPGRSTGRLSMAQSRVPRSLPQAMLIS